jgi:hypothetical protein
MTTSKPNLLMPFDSIPTTTIHPSSLFISPISQESTSPFFYTQYPHSYPYTSSPESPSQSSPQTPTPIHSSRSLKRSYASIYSSSSTSTGSPTNSSYSHPKRIRIDEKQRTQVSTLPPSKRPKYLDSDNFIYEEDIQGEEGEQTINDKATVVLRRDIEEYGKLLLRMAEVIEGALGEVGRELDMDGTVGCGRILS